MDVVESVRAYLSRWDDGGEAECRNLLATPHSNPADPASNDILSTAYHTFLTSSLLSWSQETPFSATVLVDFIQSVLGGLPSPSSTKSSSAIAFSELLIDLLWAVDVELDDLYLDANNALANADRGNAVVEEGADPVAAVARVAKVKQNAEADKHTLSRLVQQLITAGVIDANVCRERLELPLLHAAGLIADESAFGKKEIRMRTGLFYKQNKFNLLREQSEGYSKLTTELTSSIGPAHSIVDGYPMESLSAIEARARPAWERVVGLIGYFDLDPNRALDIILDVFSVHLATHYSFFLSLLSFSPWAGSPKHSVEPMAVESSPDMYRGKELDEVLKLAETHAGVSQDPPPPATMGANNSRVLAQVLGFKFAHYQGTDTMEPTPRSLYLLAALLIREAFITLEDLYPHISPSEEKVGDIYNQYQASVEARIVGARVSMLAMAAPLESSGSGSKPRQSTHPEQKPETVKETPNQILGLLHALLSIGALRPAVALLTKHSWMVDAFPELADLLLRILRHSISKLYESIWPSGSDKSSFGKAKGRFANTGLISAPDRRVHITLVAPTPPSTNTTTYLFFYPNWTERVPLCSTMEDIVDIIEPLMSFVGVHISRDVNFLSKFLRIGRTHINSIAPVDPETKKPVASTDLEHPTRQFWYKILRKYLLPALPLVRGNAVCAVEVWNILRQYEVTLRWRLYGELKTETYKSHAELRVRAIQADRESKGILRRLSMQTIDSLAGAVAKLAHSDPCILFTNAVTQIMAYQNMANCILQALNFVTVMGFDVLLYIVLEALANPNKDRVKDDGVNTSDWLQNLASFTGQLYRRYSADLTPMIRYIVHQLQNGQTSELVVLQEVIRHMTGISPLPNMTDSQVIAMAGGPYLRIEAISSAARGARLEPGDMTLKGPQRLGRALMESQLAQPLLIQVAQQRQKCVYQPPTPNAPLKSLASLYDTCHGVLLQYVELLVSPAVMPLTDYVTKVLPPLTELHKVYGIPAPICMHMIRPVLNAKLLDAALAANEKERIASEEAEKRLKAALTAKRDPSTTTPRIGSPAVGDSATSSDQGQGQAPPTVEDVVMNGAEPPQPVPQNPWQPELYERFEEIKAIAPASAMDTIGPGFYLTFWQLSTYDISPPLAKYEEETANLRALSRQEDSRYISADRSSDRVKRLSAGLHRSKRERYNQFANLLTQESKDQVIAMGYTKKRMAKEKQHWFAHNPKGATLASALVEHCLHPRALISPMDADFCAQIIKIMHSLGTPGFSTLNTYDKLLSEHIKTIIFSCTEYEAQNYGRFLLGILTDLYKWHQDEQLFLNDNRSKGARSSFLPGFMLRFSNKTVVAAEDIIKWPEFTAVVRKWHRKLLKCVIDGIETGEYMHVYNSLVVLKEILPVFPCAAVHDSAGPTIQHTVDRFLEKEKRGDLRIFGNSYAAGLKKRESFWAPPTKPKLPPTASSSKPTPTGTPTPGDRPRNGGIPTAPSADTRRTAISSVATPSAPRAQLAPPNGSVLSASDTNATVTSVKQAMESIPRPEVVKRVRPDTRSPAPRLTSTDNGGSGDAMAVDSPNPSTLPTAPRRDDNPLLRAPSAALNRPSTPSQLANGTSLSRSHTDTSRPPTPVSHLRAAGGRDLLHSPKIPTSEVKALPTETTQAMPPPANPSQTLSAQELRETARQSRPSDKNDVQPSRPITDVRSASNRRRSTSPSSRPGTRNPSADSRASGGRSRTTTEGDRAEEKKQDRDSRHESRRDGHGRERSGRSNRESDREERSDRDRDRGRDRHGDRERPRERDRERGDRERERDKEHRDRDRERDRERDRDRHRRDEKDRDRETRKERESLSRSTAVASAPSAGDERARTDSSRRRDTQDDSLGKRRRPVEDESDRAAKRPSRKESHHEDRSRRTEKDGHDRTRESDRRRKDRDQPEADNKPLTVDTKISEKPIPQGPASASRALPPTTPSAPRAMSSNEVPRPSKSEKEWRGREQPQRMSPSGPSPSSSQPTEPPAPTGSLRSRISDKEPSRSTPQAPASHRKDGVLSDGHGDISRKRASSERDTGDSSHAKGDKGTVPAKRPKIDRERWKLANAAMRHLEGDRRGSRSRKE